MTLNWNIGENRIKKNQTSTINFHVSLIYHISLLRYISYEKIISIVLFQVSSHPFSIPPWRVPNSSLLLMGKGWWTAVYMKNKQVNIPNLLEGWKTGINSWLFYLLHETKRSLKDDTTHWSVNGPFSWKWNQRMSKKNLQIFVFEHFEVFKADIEIHIFEISIDVWVFLTRFPIF